MNHRCRTSYCHFLNFCRVYHQHCWSMHWIYQHRKLHIFKGTGTPTDIFSTARSQDPSSKSPRLHRTLKLMMLMESLDQSWKSGQWTNGIQDQSFFCGRDNAQLFEWTKIIKCCAWEWGCAWFCSSSRFCNAPYAGQSQGVRRFSEHLPRSWNLKPNCRLENQSVNDTSIGQWNFQHMKSGGELVFWIRYIGLFWVHSASCVSGAAAVGA